MSVKAVPGKSRSMALTIPTRSPSNKKLRAAIKKDPEVERLRSQILALQARIVGLPKDVAKARVRQLVARNPLVKQPTLELRIPHYMYRVLEKLVAGLTGTVGSLNPVSAGSFTGQIGLERVSRKTYMVQPNCQILVATNPHTASGAYVATGFLTGTSGVAIGLPNGQILPTHPALNGTLYDAVGNVVVSSNLGRAYASAAYYTYNPKIFLTTDPGDFGSGYVWEAMPVISDPFAPARRLPMGIVVDNGQPGLPAPEIETQLNNVQFRGGWTDVNPAVNNQTGMATMLFANMTGNLRAMSGQSETYLAGDGQAADTLVLRKHPVLGITNLKTGVMGAIVYGDNQPPPILGRHLSSPDLIEGIMSVEDPVYAVGATQSANSHYCTYDPPMDGPTTFRVGSNHVGNAATLVVRPEETMPHENLLQNNVIYDEQVEDYVMVPAQINLAACNECAPPFAHLCKATQRSISNSGVETGASTPFIPYGIRTVTSAGRLFGVEEFFQSCTSFTVIQNQSSTTIPVTVNVRQTFAEVPEPSDRVSTLATPIQRYTDSELPNMLGTTGIAPTSHGALRESIKQSIGLGQQSGMGLPPWLADIAFKVADAYSSMVNQTGGLRRIGLGDMLQTIMAPDAAIPVRDAVRALSAHSPLRITS